MLPLLILAAVFIAATIDIRQHDGRVVRGVRLGSTDISSMTAAELDRELDRLDALVEGAPVYIETPDAAYQIGADRLGLTIDRPATTAAALDAGRGGSPVTRPFRWIGSLFSTERVDAVVRLDPDAAEDGLAAVAKTISVEPGDPSMVLRNGRLELEPGRPGSILDVTRLVRDLSSSLPSQPGDAISVEAFTTSDAMIDVEIQAVVDRMNGATTRPISLVADAESTRIEPALFRSWLSLDQTVSPPVPTIDAEALYAEINRGLGIGQGGIDTTTLIVTGDQIRLPVENATICCTAGTADTVLSSVLDGQTSMTVDLLVDDLTPLADLGIDELVGSFTTQHPAGQDRVVNIQRMADIVRGAVIAPGDSFSLNGFVGERTAAKGFVPAGVIYDGVFTEDVGGGVSQFATTLFNAAFFGGLDLDQYQAHSIYIDRYPFGREATVNFPGIDLVISNPTDRPIMIWTEYTPGSITVKLFGSATVFGDQTDQVVTELGDCQRVQTERTRYWVDGRTEVDYVGATYQPEEGLDCDGNRTIAPPECADDEGLIDSDDDGFGDACALASRICPPDATATDSDDDGVIDFCLLDGASCPAGTVLGDTDNDGETDTCVESPNGEPPASSGEGNADDGPDPSGGGDSGT